jgi:uncharacterized heparinase superfamily protein
LPKENWKDSFKKKNILKHDSFTFLNQSHLFKDIGWNSKAVPKLWIYNLHYFDFINQNAEKDVEYDNWIELWITQNPMPSIGWDSYPSSLRIVNWIKFHLAGNNLSEIALKSLHTQACWLSRRIEYHIEGNHLFANGKALIFAGVFFDSNKKNSFKILGIEIITAEIKKQILNDGSHFELSPMYHALITEDILDIINLAKIYPGSLDERFLNSLKDTVVKMISWLNAMTHPDGSMPFFNDSVNNISRSYEEIKDYALLLELELKHINSNLINLNDCGYHVFQSDDYKILIDMAHIGPTYQPGHGHADALSFEASILKRKFITNLGISAYQGKALRLKERGTESHSTIVIDGKNSSDVWGEFRVGNRAKVFNKKISSEMECYKIAGSHNGYKTLIQNLIHQREFHLYKKKFVIIDEILGQGNHNVQLLFHLHPDTEIKRHNEFEILLCHHGLDIKFESTLLKYFLFREYQYSPEFGLKIPTKSLVLESSFALPCKIKSSFAW